jgi:rhodanese-related sulfurtransferase
MMSEHPLEITCKETKALMDGENPPLLIDCREIHEFEFCRIEGAVLMPLSEFDGKAEGLFRHVDQEAIVYCHHGVRSLYAVQYLHDKGFTNTLSMKGGIDVWSAVVDKRVERY